MEKSNLSLKNLKVGLTIFIGMVILLLFIMIVGSEANVFVKTYDLKLFVTDVEGLSKGSMVSLGGLKIGSVKDMEFLSGADKNGIDITLTIKQEFQKQITITSKASIKTIGLLGDKFVDISIGQPGDRLLAEYEYLPVKLSFNIEEVAIDLKNSLQGFTSTIKKVDGIIETINEGKGSLGKMIKSEETIDLINKFIYSLNDIAGAVQNKKGSLGKAVYEPDLYHNIMETVSGLSSITDSVKTGKGSLGKLMFEDSLYNNIKSVSGKIDNLLSKTNENNNVVGGLLNDNNLYQDFSKMINELNALIKDIKSEPKKYLKISLF
jgi:phospholipid/cholesterol/gamma-HCH transport system substrate-binding protein